MAKLTIYKASAGSGKTYRLMLEYIKLLVENPHNYRHTLAVTFTNKATTEMKERILHGLYLVSLGLDKALTAQLAKETGEDEITILNNTHSALALLLHDYDRFSISTIDSFFQGVLRSFARETGLYGSYEVDLDQEAILFEAVDRLMMRVDADTELRSWLLEMSEDQLEQGNDWQIRPRIAQLGKEIEKESFHNYLVAHPELDVEREKLRHLKASVFKTKKWFETEMQDFGKEAMKIFLETDLEPSDLKGGTRSFANFFVYLANGRTDRYKPNITTIAACNNEENWYTKKTDKSVLEKIRAAYPALNALLLQAISMVEEKYLTYNTAVQIMKNLHALGVLSILAAEIREIGKERNTLLLSEGNQLLKNIIGDNDAPFVYEKIGNYYQHFMIDEFQDTSVTQWQNFKPLVLNSLAEGHPNLVVGDVKQSIYRWRNSDWQLLNVGIRNDMPQYQLDEVQLDANWRSYSNIIEFNNFIFQTGPRLLQQKFTNEAEGAGGHVKIPAHLVNIIASVFHDVKQRPSGKKEGGYIQAKFWEKPEEGDFNELTFLINDIERLQRTGYKASDLAVLVRTNKDGLHVSNALSERRKTNPADGVIYDVVSDDSLFLHTSPLVRFVLSMFRYVLQPYNKIVALSAMHVFETQLLPSLLRTGNAPGGFMSLEDALDDTDASLLGTFIASAVQKRYFPFIHSESFSNLLKQWATATPQGLLYELEKQYHLNYLAGEQANMQALKDVIADFARKEADTVYNFLEWWSEKGDSVKVQTASERNAITIITIHKSKGLEFPVVLIPYCDWELEPDSRKTNIIWCDTSLSPFHDFPILPVKYSNALSETSFYTDYLNEKALSIIDNLNMLYVAFTRASEGLFLYTENTKKPEEMRTVGALMQYVLQNQGDANVAMEMSEDGAFRIGELITGRNQKKTGQTIILKGQAIANQENVSLRVRQNYEGFLEPNRQRGAGINQGKLMHELLSYISRSADIDSALSRMIREGKIIQELRMEYQLKMEKILMHPKCNDWFNGKCQVLNEYSILLPGYTLYRPDRMMVREGEMIVVDYKTSKEASHSHRKQVVGYMEHLKQMNYRKVSGYVWYILEDEILDVEDASDWH